MPKHFLLILAAVLSAASARAATEPNSQGDTAAALTLDQCVDIAINRSGQIAEARARVTQVSGLLAEVESIFYPKLMGMAFIAPMYTVRGDIFNFEVKWQKLKYWGPYTHLEAVLAQPLYTFGRATAGRQAALNRVTVEKARVREAENMVALEVRRLYFIHLFTLTIMPSLQFAKRTADDALSRALELYELGTGEVTQTDISRLRYAETEVRRFIRMTEQGAELSLTALKHTMGLPAHHTLVLAENRLPPPSDEHLNLATLLQEASELRPEWSQLHHGAKAALALEQAERLANAPVAFLAGQVEFNWAPTRENTTNPYHFDRFNNLFGGLALGLQFDLDPAMANARVVQARGMQDEVAALRQFASTGIPLQVRQAHGALDLARDLVEYAREAERSTRQWMNFAGTAYASGTGEARDLLEGIMAYLQTRRSQFESLRDYHIAKAELLHAVGRR